MAMISTPRLREAHDFLKKESDLFASFIWRAQKDGQWEADETEIDESEFTRDTEDLLPVKTRLKMCQAERESVVSEEQELEKKMQKDIDTLRAVLEECRMRIAETKKSVYDLKLATVVKGPQAQNSRVNAEKVKVFIQEKLKAKHALVKKYKTKNAAATTLYNKLQSELKTKTDNERDSLHSVDLEQLRINNSQYNQKILEKNKELFWLKRKGGKMVQVLNTAKHKLSEELEKKAATIKKLKDRQRALDKLQEKSSSLKARITAEKKIKVQAAGNAFESFRVEDYMKLTSDELALSKQVETLREKLERH